MPYTFVHVLLPPSYGRPLCPHTAEGCVRTMMKKRAMEPLGHSGSPEWSLCRICPARLVCLFQYLRCGALRGGKPGLPVFCLRSHAVRQVFAPISCDIHVWQHYYRWVMLLIHFQVKPHHSANGRFFTADGSCFAPPGAAPASTKPAAALAKIRLGELPAAAHAKVQLAAETYVGAQSPTPAEHSPQRTLIATGLLPDEPGGS